MYCIKCGVQLTDTEQSCPLCGTRVFHPDLEQPTACPPYPDKKPPKAVSGRKALSGLLLVIFLIPLVVSFFSDFQQNGQWDWFGYVAGGLGVCYVMLALPLWFRKPNPVIFVPCDFAAVALYLLYINLATNGQWFVGFALPVVAGLAIIICTIVTLVRYVKRGLLYIWGGAGIALGALIYAIEFLLVQTFGIPFIGWAIYPLIVLTLLGGSLIYLAINRVAREVLARKLFF